MTKLQVARSTLRRAFTVVLNANCEACSAPWNNEAAAKEAWHCAAKHLVGLLDRGLPGSNQFLAAMAFSRINKEPQVRKSFSRVRIRNLKSDASNMIWKTAWTCDLDPHNTMVAMRKAMPSLGTGSLRNVPPNSARRSMLGAAQEKEQVAATAQQCAERDWKIPSHQEACSLHHRTLLHLSNK